MSKLIGDSTMVENRYKHKNNLLSREQSLSFLKRERRAFYDSIGSIVCPALSNSEVYFTAQGFYHLINESNSTQGDSKMRKPEEQYLKLQHLQYVPYILKECVGISEKRQIRKKIKDQWKTGIHYELTCMIEHVGLVSVIVEQIGDSNHKFLSVFPLYKKSNNKKRPKGRS